MNNMKKLASAAFAVCAAAGLVVLLTQAPAGQVAGTGRASGVATVRAAGAPHAAGSVQGPAPLTLASTFAPPAAASAPVAASPLSTMSPPRFAVDSRGKLVLNADTHANLEKLLLEEDPDARAATLARVSAGLPAQAAAELKVLVNQFQQYTTSLSHTISPENAPQNEHEGNKLIDSLHALRVSYLGAETTQAMFGAEEATTRQIIALMGADKDPNRTQEEKAERAQEIISKGTQPPAS